MSSADVADWLTRHGSFQPRGPGYEWDYDEVIAQVQPDALAGSLMRFAAQPGKQAALALDALTYGVAWLSQICGDASNAQPRAPDGGAWLAQFTDAVLAGPAFIRGCALAFTPPLPLGEQHYVDRRADAYLASHRAPAIDKIEDFAIELAFDDARTPADAERLWWAIFGGSLGIASRLVRAAEVTAFAPSDLHRRPRVVELRRHLVEAAHDALIAGVPFWARAWMIEHTALVDRALLEDLLEHEPEPWLADQMRFELAVPPAERAQRWASWLV